MIEVTTDNDDPRLGNYPLVAGTAWLFARPEHDRNFDTLFVDQAGQVSLANIIVAGSAARNIVLVGDPMQLAQPIQGVHPGQSGRSALAYLLGDMATVTPDRGIFLPTSRRMHPLICSYISDLVYEGRLCSDDGAARQGLLLDRAMSPLASAGLRFEAVSHSGNGQSSEEEAAAVLCAWRNVVGQKFRDREGKVRTVGPQDILVVAPYNAQVNLLRSTLPAGARVGTIDKFQGQEAPVCLVSMATSSGDELPRNIEFLFSVNRLNVAISRARALVIVFASPRLLGVPCRTIEEMRLVNALCALAEYAAKSARPLPP
jgi:superfamily I DNA and/or RNA helicase